MLTCLLIYPTFRNARYLKRIVSDPDATAPVDSERNKSGSGSRKAKITFKKVKKEHEFHHFHA
jgi:hypothetical protein